MENAFNCTGSLPESQQETQPAKARALQRRDTRKTIFGGEIYLCTKKSERVHFLVWPARTNLEGGGSGRGANMLRTLAVTGSNPAMRVRFFLLVFGALGRKTQRTQTGALCAVAVAKVEARNVCFDITGARNRPIPTLLPSETCAQTPLDRPSMLFRPDPDFADAPETAQNGGFRDRSAAVRVLEDFSA